MDVHNGYVFQIIGDAFCVAFHTADDGLKAALQIQRDLKTSEFLKNSEVSLRVRMGLHTGSAELQEDDYRGYLTMAKVQRVMSVAYGGQVLLSNASAELLHGELQNGISLRDMKEHRLKGLADPEHLWQLVAPDLQNDFPPLQSLKETPNNLPVQLTSFIGREKEVGQIKQRLEKNRLVTLTGSGGIGKTRLSIQVASELLDDYPHGVWLVELAALADPALVTQTVCAALDVTPQGNTSPLSVLTDYLKPKKILLVVDNCEHLIDASAQLCEALLHACPNVRIIASSREALGIDGENAYRVPSLSLPNPNDGLGTIEKSEAVTLFIERATATLPEFEMTEANASAVAQICQRLDGIALAIELAASRVKLLKVEQIASRLDDAFRLLTGGSRTALPRQQTLRALIDWSYNLLSGEEKTVLRRLSVFVGGWTLEAAEYVCENPNMLDLFTHLVDKSLVVVDREYGDEARYYLLETIRQYAREKLTDSGEGEAVRELHTRCYVELAERAEPKLRWHNQTVWLDRIEHEHDNLRIALEWSINNNVDLGLRIANSLIWFWDTRDHFLEGLQSMERLLAAGPLDPSNLHANALARAGWLAMIAYDEERLATFSDAGIFMSREVGEVEGLALSLSLSALVPFWHGNFDQALQLAEEGLALFEEAGIKWGKQFTLSQIGYISQALGNYERALSAYQESLVLSREADDVSFIAYLISCLGLLAFEQSHYARALGLFQESLSLAREVKNRNMIAEDLQSMGEVNIALKQYPQAKVLLEESIAVDREVGNYRRQALVLNLLGRVACLQGDYQQAVRLNRESLRMAQRNGRHQTLAWCLVSLAELATLLNHPKKAARLFGAAESMPELYIAFWPHERLELEQTSIKIHANLDNAIFKAEYEAGKQMTLDEAVAFALQENL